MIAGQHPLMQSQPGVTAGTVCHKRKGNKSANVRIERANNSLLVYLTFAT